MAAELKLNGGLITNKPRDRDSRAGSGERFLTPLREEVVGSARGIVLEVGAGKGLNFAFYQPEQVERVEAIEPNGARLADARVEAVRAPVPVQLLRASVESLPFADESFDSVVATLVFCSVGNPLRGLSEVRRVLKPGGKLLMIEHVRARGALVAAIQTIGTPMARLLDGNCHWNRDTESTVREAGFTIERRSEATWLIAPFLVLHAAK